MKNFTDKIGEFYSEGLMINGYHLIYRILVVALGCYILNNINSVNPELCYDEEMMIYYQCSSIEVFFNEIFGSIGVLLQFLFGCFLLYHGILMKGSQNESYTED